MATDTNSVDALLQAAQFLEAANDGDDAQCKGHYKRPPSYCRSTHNILEKNRRAQLRDCLEMLRESVPFSDKMTTLSLLQSAKRYIVILKRQKEEQEVCKQQLSKQLSGLSHRLVELGGPAHVPEHHHHDHHHHALTAKRQEGKGKPAAPPPLLEEDIYVDDLDPSVATAKRIHLDPNTVLEECEAEVIIDVDSNSSDCEESSCSGSDGGITNNSVKWSMEEVVITTSGTADEQNVEILSV